MLTSALAAAIVLQGQTDYVVQPYYVYPNDFTRRAEHLRAIDSGMRELQGWFRDRVGASFTLRPTIEVKGRQDYVNMRVGPNPTSEDRANKSFMPSWFGSLREAVGGEFRPRQVSVIFAAGGGGFTTGRFSGEDSGVAVVGDWYLQAESNFTDPAAIPAPAGAWQVRGSAHLGILASRLGQAFGLLNPRGLPGQSLVGSFQAYPNLRLAPQEQLILRNSPFFGFGPGENQVPRLKLETDDETAWGQTFFIQANGVRESDLVEFCWMGKATDNPNASVKPTSAFVPVDGVSDDRFRVTAPRGAGPGFIRLWRGSLRSNIVPVNVYAELPPK